MKILVTVPDLSHCPLKEYDKYLSAWLCKIFGCVCVQQCRKELRLDAMAVDVDEPTVRIEHISNPLKIKSDSISAKKQPVSKCPLCGKSLSSQRSPVCSDCRPAYKKNKQKEYQRRWRAKKQTAALNCPPSTAKKQSPAVQPEDIPPGHRPNGDLVYPYKDIRNWTINLIFRDKFWHWEACCIGPEVRPDLPESRAFTTRAACIRDVEDFFK